MNAENTHELFHRLNLEELQQAGRAALRERNYERAHAVLREAVRRAPFRQDLREMLSAALEGKLAVRASPPANQSTLEAFRVRQQAHPSSAILKSPGSPPRQAASAPTSSPRLATPSLGGRRRPGNFERRHKRGPLSAMLLGGFAGVGLVAIGLGLGWLYLQRQGQLFGVNSASAAGGAEAIRLSAAIDQSKAYVAQRKFSLALDQLTSLPPSPARDRRLAEIYMEMGNDAYKQTPPRLEAALDNYSKAVQYDENNPVYGCALADVYYMLSGQRDESTGESNQFLDRARQALQAVIDRNPEYVAAYDRIKKIAVTQRDYKLLQQTLQRIIDISPKDSEDARNARNDLESLGLKVSP